MAPPCRLIHDRLNASLSWERSIVVDESVDREECASGDEELVEKRTDTSRSSEAILIMTVSCPILYSRYVLICGLFFSLVRPHPWIVNKRWVWRIQCQYYIVDERRANINILANLQYNSCILISINIMLMSWEMSVDILFPIGPSIISTQHSFPFLSFPSSQLLFPFVIN